MAVNIAIAHSTTPFISTYPWSSGFGTKRSDPATLPTGYGYGVVFSPSGTDIAVGHGTTPFISTYPWSSGFGTKRSDPATLPTGIGYGVVFSPSGADIALAHAVSPRISTYPWSSGFGTKRSDPATLPTGNGNAVVFSPSGADIAVGHVTTPFISTYPWSSGFGTKRSDPATLPPSNGLKVAFGSDTGGSLSPGTLANDASIGFTAWSNPGNAAVSDDVYATVTVITAGDSNYLAATNFGFAIPADATINGIVAEVQKKGTSVSDNVIDLAVRIIKGGAIGSTDKASATAWPDSEAYSQYGSTSDLWGETWAYSDINGSTFGVAIAAQTASLGGETASVDHIRITVYYTAAAAQSVVPVMMSQYRRWRG